MGPLSMDKNMWPENLVAAPPKNPEDVRRVLDKRKTPLDAPWELLSAGAQQRAQGLVSRPGGQGLSQRPLSEDCTRGGRPPPPPHPERSSAAPWEGKRLPAKTAHRDVNPTPPATTRKVKVMGEKSQRRN